MYTFTAIGPNLASLTGTTLEYASVYGVAGFPTWASVDGLQVWDLPAVCLQYGADITHMVVSEYGTPVGYLTLTPVAMGPICAACGDITCVADDAHHKVTGAPTNVAPYFREANRARSEATDNEDQVAEWETFTPEYVAARDVWSSPEVDKVAAQDRGAHVWRTVTLPRLTH